MLKKNKSLKISLLAVMLIVFLIPVAFAQGNATATCTNTIAKLINILYRVMDLSSWIRIILSGIAGKLMTNDLVYGEVIWFDNMLWSMWNVAKSFANIILGFFFLYLLIKYIFNFWEAESPFAKIKKLLFAGVVIQASRFIMLVLVDIATICFSVASSFPAQVISRVPSLYTSFKANIESDIILGSRRKGRNVEINTNLNKYMKDNSQQLSIEFIDGEVSNSQGANPDSLGNTDQEMFDKLLPRMDTLSGPFFYLGFSIFRSQEVYREDRAPGINCLDTLNKELLKVLLGSVFIILYSVILLVLVVILVMRIFFLWIFIILSPILFLLKMLDIKPPWGMDLLDFDKIVKLIFKPVLFAFFVGMAMVVIILFQSILSSNNEAYINGVILESEKKEGENFNSSMEIEEVVRVSIRGGKKALGDYMLAVISLALMWFLFKASITSRTGIWAIDKFSEKASDFIGNRIGDIPLVPTSVGNLGLSSVFDPKAKSSPIINAFESKYRDDLNKQKAKDINKMRSTFGMGDAVITPDGVQQQKLEIASRKHNNPSVFVEELSWIKSANNGIRFSEIKQYIPDWIEKNDNSSLMKYLWSWFKKNDLPAKNDEKYLEKLFEQPEVAKNFYKNVLGGEAGLVRDYQSLQAHNEVKI